MANKVNLGCATLLNNAGLIAAGGAGRWQHLDRGRLDFYFFIRLSCKESDNGGRNWGTYNIDHQGIF